MCMCACQRPCACAHELPASIDANLSETNTDVVLIKLNFILILAGPGEGHSSQRMSQDVREV